MMKYKVLIVEDDTDINNLLKKIPFSVVVLGNFRRFFFSLFHFFSPLLDFSHIYNKFLMPFVDFFY